MTRYLQILIIGLGGAFVYIMTNEVNALKMIASFLFMIYLLLLIDGTKYDKEGGSDEGR